MQWNKGLNEEDEGEIGIAAGQLNPRSWAQATEGLLVCAPDEQR